MNQSENINELATALAKAQGEFTPAVKDANNPFFKSKYANLCSVVKACQEHISKHGLSVSHSTTKEDGQWLLVTTLMHASGQWKNCTIPLITAKGDIQSFGSSITYARRYGTAAVLNIVTDEDDDGEAACGRDQPATKQKPSYEKKSAAQVVAEEKKDNVKRIYITEDQGKELAKILSQCSEEYQQTVWTFLADKKNITSFTEMNPVLYESIKTRALAEIKKNE